MKRVVKEVQEEVVKLEDIDNNNIYAFISSYNGIVYKAHKLTIEGVGKKQWAFISLDNSKHYHNTSNTLEELLEPEAGLVLEFEDQEEFIDWILLEREARKEDKD